MRQILLPILLSGLLSACGTTSTPTDHIDMTGDWAVKGEFGVGSVVQQTNTATFTAMTTDQPERGDFQFKLPGANAGAYFGGNTIKGTLTMRLTDAGQVDCQGVYTASGFTSDQCIFVHPENLPAGAFVRYTLARL